MHISYRMAAALLVTSLVGGCSSSAPTSAVQREASHLRAIISLYNYAASDVGRPPASEQEFKAFVAKKGGAIMERLKITNPDDLFVSERDNKPFVIVYGQRPAGMSDIVAYEQTGVDGVRQVGKSLGNIEDADETRFRELVPTPPAK